MVAFIISQGEIIKEAFSYERPPSEASFQALVEYQNSIDYEVSELSITAGDDVAFSHSLNRISGTLKNGQKSDRWLRWTTCYRRSKGQWLIVHEQVSVPVDVRSGKAILDLKP